MGLSHEACQGTAPPVVSCYNASDRVYQGCFDGNVTLTAGERAAEPGRRRWQPFRGLPGDGSPLCKGSPPHPPTSDALWALPASVLVLFSELLEKRSPRAWG